MTFQGTIAFPDAEALAHGIAALEAQATDSFVQAGDLRVRGLTIEVEKSASAPASMWGPTLLALEAVANHAATGGFDAEFELDGIERARISAPGSASAEPAADDPREALLRDLFGEPPNDD